MKRIYTISLLGLLLTFFYDAAFAQNVTVSGKVSDATNGQPLVGVSVGVQGTSTGTQTDANGNYRISASSNAQLTFTYVGYVTQTLATGSNGNLDVKLAPQVNDLQQVVVVGYGTQRKVDVTGSVATVKGDDLAKQSTPNAVSALQGKVAGVNIVNNGAPGSSPQVTIRGTGTVFGNTSVLYIVDGVWYSDINFLNPADIDNISVLKDASSTAIYGIRAANGVIIVTTKRGRKGQTSINYNGYAGFQRVTNQVKMANASEYATAINELSTSNGSAPVFANTGNLGAGTDWYKQALRSAFTANHQVSVNGGSEKSDYNVSLGVLDQDGIVQTNSFKRYTLSLSNNVTPIKNLDFGVKLNGSYSRGRNVNTNTIFHQLYGAAPVIPVYNADGSYGDPNNNSLGVKLGGGNNYNPQATIDFYNQRSERYQFTGNAFAQLTILKNFKFRTSFGGEFTNAQNTNYTPVYYATIAQQTTQSTLTRYRGERRNWIAENTLTYDNRFGDHKLTVLLGQTAQREQLYAYTLSAQNVPAGAENSYFSLGTSTTRNIDDSGSGLNTFSSYFGRVNYSFKDRYLLNASIRRDGASQFYGNGTYRNLPAVGAGWVISQENFMKDQQVFNTLKLRGSWGRVANAGVPYNLTIQPTATTPGYIAVFGRDQLPYTGTSINSVPTPFLISELSESVDLGLEGSMFDNRLSFDLDYYNRTSKGAVFPVYIPGSVGIASSFIYSNAADIRNRGFEAALTWRSKNQGAFNYTISGNVGYNQNTVLKVTSTLNNVIYSGGTGLSNGALATRTMEGRPVGEFYGYQVAGVFQNTAEVAASAQPSAKPGDFRYTDTNGDGKIDGNDRVALGNPNPKFNYGVNTTFNYKSFDLTVDLQGVAGVDIYNTNLAYRFGNENFTKDFYDNRWHGQGTSNTYPSVNIGTTSNSAPNSFFVSSGSYFRVRNLQLGYTLPTSITEKIRMKRLRIYANAQNAINVFGYKGFSPEIGADPTNSGTANPLTRGLDANVYPLFATYNFGINVTF
jgi:TonB-linked SusC/RagA family outer membrane protein